MQQILQLRTTFDKKKQSQNIDDSISYRHNGYLKEMLINKFLVKNSYDKILQFPEYFTNEKDDPKKFKNHQNYMKVIQIVKQEFDKFINGKHFTQKNLIEFENDLTKKVDDFMKKEGIERIQNKSRIQKQQNDVRSLSQQKIAVSQVYQSRDNIQRQQKSSSRIFPTTVPLSIEIYQNVNSLNKKVENIKSADSHQKISLPFINNARQSQRNEENIYSDNLFKKKLSKQIKANRSHILQQVFSLNKKKSQANVASNTFSNNQNEDIELENKFGKNKSSVNIFNNKFRNNEFIQNAKDKPFQKTIETNYSQNLIKVDKNEPSFRQISKSTNQAGLKTQQNLQILSTKNLEQLNVQKLQENKNEQQNTAKQQADFKMKMAEKRSNENNLNELDSIPSDLSQDMWGEVPKYNYLLHQENLKKQKDDLIKKKQIVKISLDEQIVQQRQKKLEDEEKVKLIDDQMLKKAKDELNQEKLQKLQLKQKVIQQKEQRDIMLKEANQIKKNEFQIQRKNEIVEVEELQKQLEKEKKQKLEKKKKEREQAWQVIKENENEKEKRMKLKEDEKAQQNKVIEEYNKQMDEMEKKRAQEWAEREARIQNAMGRMAETVIKKSNEAEKAEELKLLANAHKIDKQAEERDRKKKEEAKKREVERKQVLDLQILEKKISKKQEQEENKKYVQMILEKDEKDKQDQKNKEISNFKKMQEIQKFQKLQMGEFVNDSLLNPSVDGAKSGEYYSISSKIKRKNKVGGPMNIEEIKMNKELLKKISEMKKNQNLSTSRKEQLYSKDL